MGCLFTLVLAAVFSFIAYKVIPLYYRASEFQTGVEQEVGRTAAKFLGSETLRKNIMNLAAVYELPLKEEDVQIVRASTQLAVDVKYTVQVDFLVYQRPFNFEFRVTSVMGSL